MKEMIQYEELIPDLCGRNNVVILNDGKLKIIDVNNIARIVTTEKWKSKIDEEDFQNAWATLLGKSRQEFKDSLPEGYLDINQYPIGDMSIWLLGEWEKFLDQYDENDNLYRTINSPLRERLTRYIVNSQSEGTI